MNRQIKMQDIVQYTLNDYQFLQDYEVIDSYKSNKNSFVACIRNSQQKVRFIKKKYNHQTLERFKVLHKLYKNGIVLCDSLFILQQCDQYYFYVIEAEIQAKNRRFQTLQQYLYYSQLNEQERKELLCKVKILIDCLHQQGQYYAGIDTRKIIVDDQKHIYLAPYDLQFQLKTDHFSRAYYSPELLTKMSKLQPQVSQQLMQKWDIWAFGCIALQILGYCCPFFMSTSQTKQLNTIKKFQVSKHFQNKQQEIRYLLSNSLLFDSKFRSLLTSQRQTVKNKTEKVSLKQILKEIRQIKQQQNIPNMFRQINIFPSQFQTPDSCELILNIINLNNVTFQKQLKISVHLNKVYHIYLDFDVKSPNKYKIHKKITIKESFTYFQTLLSKPVKIQIRQQKKTSQIFVHLQTLVLTKQQKLLWSEPVLGTYKANNGGFQKSKIKINCLLNISNQNTLKKTLQVNIKSTQKVFEQKKLGKNYSIKENIQAQADKNQQFSLNSSILKDTFPNVKIKNKNALSSKLDKILSISQISEQITLITQGFKKKMSLGQAQKQNNIQRKLTSLLQIQSLEQ